MICQLAVAIVFSVVIGTPKIDADVIFGHKDGMALTLDVFRPNKPNGAGVLFVVSGGWISKWHPPDKMLQYYGRDFDPLLDAGFTIFAIRQGSSPRFGIPDQVDDLRRAVRFIRLHANDYGVDPDRLGIYGGSSGGQLALVIGMASKDGEAAAEDPVDRESSRVAAVVAFYPPVDFRDMKRQPIQIGPDRIVRKGEKIPALKFFGPGEAEAVSPIVHVSKDDPPTLLIHGDKDRNVPISHSRNMIEELKAKGVESDLVVIEGAGHGFRAEDQTKAVAALVRWFRDHLSKSRRQ